MAVVTELDELLNMIICATCELLSCERATIFLYDIDRDELFSKVATGEAIIRVRADKGIVGEAAQQRRIINVPDAYADPRFNQSVDRETGYRTRNLLTLPLENLDGRLVGVLQALNRKDQSFDEGDELLAEALAAQAGVILDRARLLDEFQVKQRMQHGLELARQIQQNLMPARPPKVAGYGLAGWNRSADETGGDCFDFLPLDEHRTAILLADATGHGIGPALIIAECRALVRALLTTEPDLARLATRANALLAEDLADNRFVTAFIGVLDARAHVLRYVSCGQGPLLFRQGGEVHTRVATGLPLGVIGDYEYDSAEVFEFARGDAAALLTDGFFEASNAAEEQFGEGRVAELLAGWRDVAPQAFVDDLTSRIAQFTDGRPPGDDLTAVIIHREQ